MRIVVDKNLSRDAFGCIIALQALLSKNKVRLCVIVLENSRNCDTFHDNTLSQSTARLIPKAENIEGNDGNRRAFSGSY